MRVQSIGFGLCLFVAGAVPFAAHAASFDCTKAKLPAEKIICADRALNAADTRMGQVYREALAKSSSRAVGHLRVDQLQWLAWMQQVCHADGTGAAAEVSKCMLTLYADRTKLLAGAVVRRDGISFLTRTQYLAAPETDANGSPEYPGFGTLQATWPEVDSTDDAWQAWNAAVEQLLLKLASTAQTTAATPAKAAQWTDDLAADADTTITATVRGIEHERVTAAVNVSGMGHGAAHPSEIFQTMTWLLPQKRTLRATDVFLPGQAWRQTVSKACWLQLQQGNAGSSLYDEVKGPDAKPLLQVIDDTSNWTLETDGLHISYPEYSVAPRAAAPDDAVIPWKTLHAVLRPDFQTP